MGEGLIEGLDIGVTMCDTGFMPTTRQMPQIAKTEPFGINVKVTFANGYSVVVPPSHPLIGGPVRAPKTAEQWATEISKRAAR